MLMRPLTLMVTQGRCRRVRPFINCRYATAIIYQVSSRKGPIMRKPTILSLMVVTSLCLSLGVKAADFPKLRCPVSGKEASKEHAVSYNGGQVCFCCDQCRKTFAAKTNEFAAKANVQLVLSGQFKEVKCPLEGYTLNPITAMEVGGVRILFCCKGCKNVVALARQDEQINLVFNDKAFKKGFEKIAAEEKK